tara:strand:- start:858 stop:1304 length:447 start_codon:yes stop_codon:yes gene_type:complete
MKEKSGLLLFQGKKNKTQKEKTADKIDNYIDKVEKLDTKTMKVRINPEKEGKLSTYAKKNVTKTNKKGKVTVSVPKSEMWSEKSKLFENDAKSFTKNGKSYIDTADPAGQSSAKAFKKTRRRDKAATVGASILGGAMTFATLLPIKKN